MRSARVVTRIGEQNAPADETAVHNAALFQAAPRMRESLQILIQEEHETMRPLTANKIRELLSKIDAGADNVVHVERAKELQRYEDVLQQQVMEMSLQSDARKPDQVPEEDQGEEEEGHSFGW